MNRSLQAKRVSVIWLCLNIFRYNLFGIIDTYDYFLLFDALSWSIVTLILFLVCTDVAIQNIFLFTFVLTFNAVYNAAVKEPTNTNISELVLIPVAGAAVLLNTWINRHNKSHNKRTGHRGG